MTELQLHSILSFGMIGVAVPTFVALFFINAPYGRYVRGSWGPTVPSRLAWTIMESPSMVLFVVLFALGSHRGEVVPLCFLVLWQLHYVNRTVVFPLRLRESGKRMPLAVIGMALTFNVWNVYVNSRWISELGAYDRSWLVDPRFIAGVAIMLTGFGINQWADTVLIRLRRDGAGEGGYAIPRAGLYRWVSCPNYLGEILEWIGWAIATWSWGGAAFAVYTFANLAPRAIANHRWYHETFADYPRQRRALIPGVW